MAKNNSGRLDLVQDFFESLATMHRLVGQHRSIGVGKYKEKRRGSERRQPQTELLYTLSRNGEMTIKQIASYMHITSSAATQMVETLVKQGLLERMDDPKDRRIVRVKMSKKGSLEFSKFKKEHLGNVNEIIKFLTNDEIKYLVKIRKRVIEAAAKKNK